ncbi:MAG: hypothetical protein RR139_10140, partial [Lachnospiraceae bacterium]
KKVGDFIKKESESLINTGLEIPRDYIYHRRFYIKILTVSDYSILPSIAGGLVFSFIRHLGIFYFYFMSVPYYLV